MEIAETLRHFGFTKGEFLNMGRPTATRGGLLHSADSNAAVNIGSVFFDRRVSRQDKEGLANAED